MFHCVHLDATNLHLRNATSASPPTARARCSASMSATPRTKSSGRAFVTDLEKRGRSGFELVLSDQRAGFVAALKRTFQGTAHHRRRVHFGRNLLALVPKSHFDMVAAVFRTIFAQPDASTVAATWDEVRD
jgi:putative transposase